MQGKISWTFVLKDMIKSQKQGKYFEFLNFLSGEIGKSQMQRNYFEFVSFFFLLNLIEASKFCGLWQG